MTKRARRFPLVSSIAFLLAVLTVLPMLSWADEAKTESITSANESSASALTLFGEDNLNNENLLQPGVISTHASTKITWKRLSGKTAFDTMQAITKEGWKNNCGGTVVLATSNSFKDALSAAGVAGLTGAPVLLTSKDSLASQTRAELIRIKPSRVIVAGGPAAISKSVESEIKNLTHATVTRVYGRTATGTAAALNMEFMKGASDTAIVATSKSFRDALSAAPVAYAKHYPIFLTEGPNSISNEALSAMKACGIKRVVVIGGTQAVSAKVTNKIKAKGITIAKRLGGKNAYDTSNKVATWALSLGMKATNTGAATAKNYKDALCGAALCGKRNSALILVDTGKLACINSYVKTNAASIKPGYIFGGLKAVNDAVTTLLQTPVINYRSIYGALLKKAIKGSNPFDSMFKSGQYACEDIDKDGIKELIVAVPGGMNGHALFFTIRYGKSVQCVDSFHFEMSTLGYLKDGKMYHEYYGVGIYGVNYLTLNGTRLVSKELYSHTGIPFNRYISGDTPAARKFWASHPKGKEVDWTYNLSDFSRLS